MNKKITPYIYILFFSYFFNSLNAQKKNDFNLEITSANSFEKKVIDSIHYKRTFTNSNQLKKAANNFIDLLKEKGYYSLVIDSIILKEKKYTYYLNLGLKTKFILLKINPKDKDIIFSLNLRLNNNTIQLANEQLQPFLNSISNSIVNDGEIFSKVQLTNVKVKNQILYGNLKITRTLKRKINRVIVKEYSNFPKSFIQHYLNLDKSPILNEKKIEEISNKINKLRFVSEIKKPEILFSKDSTILYMYLKKKKSSSFDGLINFSSENSKITFRGYLDVLLLNMFNKGEEISLNWINNGNDKQDLTLKTKLPYLFNSKFSITTSFNLYRNDSTFINTTSKIKIDYPISSKIDLSFLYNHQNSNNNIIKSGIIDFEKNFIGVGYNYHSKNEKQIHLKTEFLFGQRNSNSATSNQNIITIEGSRLFKISKNTRAFVRSESQALISSTYLENELFREGGLNSIRGFNEQSIFTSKYSYLNSEFRFLTKNQSFLYSIHDLGIFEINDATSTLFSFGIGYHYFKKTNSINLSYTYGSNNGKNSFFNNSILSVKFLAFF